MRNSSLLLLLFTVLFVQCQTQPIQIPESKKVIVGVFNGDGGAQTCIWETVSALQLDTSFDVRTITTSEIAKGGLEQLDAIVIPGGSGSRQFHNLGADNRERITDFVASGKGAVGICAGAYFFSNTPGYTSIGINGEQAIDIEHDNRGHGMAKFTLTAEGKKIFPELNDRDTCYVMYYEGPVFIKNETDSLVSTTLAVMESDVHEEGGAPSDMTNGKSFLSSNSYGKGRVFSSIAHPEATPGMMWMIPRMVRWTLNLPLVTYQDKVVQPDLFNAELLMSTTKLKEEATHLRALIYGTTQEKIDALGWLESHQSWDAKRRIQGSLYDQAPEVRIKAATYVANSQYLPYLEDLRTVCTNEKDATVKTQLQVQLTRLESLLQ